MINVGKVKPCGAVPVYLTKHLFSSSALWELNLDFRTAEEGASS